MNLMSWAVTLLTILFVLVCFVMTGLILLQEGKGGGLAALGGTKAAGIEGVTNPIRRATAYLAAIFFVLAIALGVVRKPSSSAFAPETEAVNAGMSSGAAKAPATPEVAPAAPVAPVTPAATPTTSGTAGTPAKQP